MQSLLTSSKFINLKFPHYLKDFKWRKALYMGNNGLFRPYYIVSYERDAIFSY